MPIATTHRPAITRTPKWPTFLPYLTIPVTRRPPYRLIWVQTDTLPDSGYFTALRVDDLLAAGKLREAADPHCTRDRPRCRRRMMAPPWRCSGRPPSRPPLLQPAHDFATVCHTQPILWRHSDEVSRGTNNAVLSVGEVALSGGRRRTRQEYHRQRSALQHR